MALDPRVLNGLLKEIPEIIAFRKWIGEEILALDSFDGLDTLSHDERAHRVAARIESLKFLKEMFGKLINTSDLTGGGMGSEYGVD